jgi:hypothetical protein
MSGKANRPPAGEPWIWLTRELIASDAWRSLGINARRFVEFLMLEHMGNGGRENGKLKAPHRQLQTFGVGDRYVTAAIRETEELGLVDCHRGGMRVATMYALTWIPNHDGAPASNKWRAYRNPNLPTHSAPESRNLPVKGKAALPVKGKADEPNLPIEGKAGSPEILPVKGKSPSRIILPGQRPSLRVFQGQQPGRRG